MTIWITLRACEPIVNLLHNSVGHEDRGDKLSSSERSGGWFAMLGAVLGMSKRRIPIQGRLVVFERLRLAILVRPWASQKEASERSMKGGFECSNLSGVPADRDLLGGIRWDDAEQRVWGCLSWCLP